MARRWGGGQPLMRGGPLLSGAWLNSEHIQTGPSPICLRDWWARSPKWDKRKSVWTSPATEMRPAVEKQLQLMKEGSVGITHTSALIAANRGWIEEQPLSPLVYSIYCLFSTFQYTPINITYKDKCECNLFPWFLTKLPSTLFLKILLFPCLT